MFNELVDDISVGVKERDYVVDVAFPNQRFISTFNKEIVKGKFTDFSMCLFGVYLFVNFQI